LHAQALHLLDQRTADLHPIAVEAVGAVADDPPRLERAALPGGVLRDERALDPFEAFPVLLQQFGCTTQEFFGDRNVWPGLR
jgi:hypothetical protein